MTTALFVLTGCTFGTELPRPGENAAAESSPDQVQPDAQLQPDPEFEQEPLPESTEQQQPADPGAQALEFEACGQIVQAGIAETISSQTDSFAVGDFKLAYSYASPSFRAAVGLESFIGIIQGSYGPLIGSSTLSFVNCVVDLTQQEAVIDVRFTEADTEVYALRYVLVNTDSGWRVDGASALAILGSGI